jgi:mRNA-degrading endonuclease RelE of RelBE toxin-antitoxin system
MRWTVAVAGPARRQVAKYPARDQLRIEAAIRSMADDPFSGDTLKLEGPGNQWRRRVGNYRLLFTVFPYRTILVSAILRRTSTTY